jgi:hypothetical protein
MGFMVPYLDVVSFTRHFHFGLSAEVGCKADK